MDNNKDKQKDDLDNAQKENFETLGYEDSNKNNTLSPGQIKAQNSKKQILRRRGR